MTGLLTLRFSGVTFPIAYIYFLIIISSFFSSSSASKPRAPLRTSFERWDPFSNILMTHEAGKPTLCYCFETNGSNRNILTQYFKLFLHLFPYPRYDWAALTVSLPFLFSISVARSALTAQYILYFHLFWSLLTEIWQEPINGLLVMMKVTDRSDCLYDLMNFLKGFYLPLQCVPNSWIHPEQEGWIIQFCVCRVCRKFPHFEKQN